MNQIRKINCIVLALPRSGSNLFFRLLQKNKLVGSSPSVYGFELFNILSTKNLDLKGVEIQQFIHQKFNHSSIKYGNVEIGIFKVFPDQIIFFLDHYNRQNGTQYALDDFFDILPQDTLFIRLQRHDKIAQAISAI